MILLFSDGSQSSNFMGIAALCKSYHDDVSHRAQYLSAMWNTAGGGKGGGVLKDFEMSCMEENTLAREYKAVWNAPSSTSEGFLDAPGLESLEFLCSNPPYRTLIEYDHLQILQENKTFLETLIQSTQWDHESIKTFRLLLLLLLQLKNKSTAQLEPEEQEVLEQALRKHQLEQAPHVARVYPFQDGALFLQKGSIYQATFTKQDATEPELVSAKKEVLLDFAPYTNAQRIELAVNGTLTSDSANDVYEKWRTYGSPALKMVACYGDIYLLLKADGSILTNVEDIDEKWKDAVWIGAGLNSVSAICGENRKLYASIPVPEHIHVQKALTYFDGMQTHYGALMKDGTLIVDKKEIGEASAAAICSVGVVFVHRERIMLYRFGSGQPAIPVSNCSANVQALCIDDCTTHTPAHLKIIWMTDKEVLHVCLNI